MIREYGKKTGSKSTESAHMVTFFSWLRREHPKYGAIAVHIRNEGKRNDRQTAKQKAEGMVKGASDIIIPGCPAFVCEAKSEAKSSRVSKEQWFYLDAADKAGAFACVAYGVDGIREAFNEWINLQP